MTTTQINTADLSGAALDWAVAKAVQADVILICTGKIIVRHWGGEWHPSTDWAQGGPLIERYSIEFISEDDGFEATAWNDERTIGCMGWGKDHLTAACRAIIVKELGETVHVPTELV